MYRLGAAEAAVRTGTTLPPPSLADEGRVMAGGGAAGDNNDCDPTLIPPPQTEAVGVKWPAPAPSP